MTIKEFNPEFSLTFKRYPHHNYSFTTYLYDIKKYLQDHGHDVLCNTKHTVLYFKMKKHIPFNIESLTVYGMTVEEIKEMRNFALQHGYKIKENS